MRRTWHRPPTILYDSYLSCSPVREVLKRVTGAQEVFNPAVYEQERSSLLAVLPKTQDELPARTQRNSYSEVLLPLSTDIEMKEHFINVFLGIRTGRLLECLDAFAGQGGSQF